MCFKVQMIEECRKYLLPNQTQVRDDVIPSRLGNQTSSHDMLIATTELSEMAADIRHLSCVFRKMMEKDPTTPPCCEADRPENTKKVGE